MQNRLQFGTSILKNWANIEEICNNRVRKQYFSPDAASYRGARSGQALVQGLAKNLGWELVTNGAATPCPRVG